MKHFFNINNKQNLLIKLLIGFTFVALGLLVFFTSFDEGLKSRILQFSGLLITTLGFLYTIYEFKIASYQYFDEKKRSLENYLDLELNVTQNLSYYSVKTRVLNKSGVDKRIYYAFLLLTKQDENIITKINSLLNTSFFYTNDFVNLNKLLGHNIIKSTDTAIIPLPFYYSENISIGNESPQYTFTFDNNIWKLKKGIYSVRFFIFPGLDEVHQLHRSTVDSLVVESVD